MPQTVTGDTVRILSIDGGGIRGILPARVLQYIEGHIGKPAGDIFHLISGTSTGGIICCGLAKGMSAKELGDFYVEHGGAIFQRSMWQRVSNPVQIAGPKYDPSTLEKTLESILGNVMLSDVKSVEMLVPTYVIQLPKPQTVGGVTSTRTPMFFKTWKARNVGLAQGENAVEFDFRLRDVARATSAAPTYFPPALVANGKNEQYGVVDGGVFANNPALCALAAAYKLYPDKQRFQLVSLGTGTLERGIPYDDAKGWGELNWLHPILSILMDGNADTVCYQCDQVLGEDHHRFEITLGSDPHDEYAVNEDFDDASVDNIARLEKLAGKLVADSTEKLDKLCQELAPDVALKASAR